MIIYVTGPESTGKTTLAQSLSAHYDCPWVPEYARQYLHETDGKYDYRDLARISKGQYGLKAQFEHAMPEKLICDTGQEVLYIWSEYKFGKVDPDIKGKLALQKGALHLLCKPDITWEPDPQREHPLERNLLFRQYEKLLEHYGLDYNIVDGLGEVRLRNTVALIDAFV